jgi:hypothetical protein
MFQLPLIAFSLYVAPAPPPLPLLLPPLLPPLLPLLPPLPPLLPLLPLPRSELIVHHRCLIDVAASCDLNWVNLALDAQFLYSSVQKEQKSAGLLLLDGDRTLSVPPGDWGVEGR